MARQRVGGRCKPIGRVNLLIPEPPRERQVKLLIRFGRVSPVIGKSLGTRVGA
ncbi:MAG: hypothetical protein IJY11_00065 [Clostridia bacterium]|nr:hypothetical protein [Clostridia bacterium]